MRSKALSATIAQHNRNEFVPEHFHRLVLAFRQTQYRSKSRYLRSAENAQRHCRPKFLRSSLPIRHLRFHGAGDLRQRVPESLHRLHWRGAAIGTGLTAYRSVRAGFRGCAQAPALSSPRGASSPAPAATGTGSRTLGEGAPQQIFPAGLRLLLACLRMHGDYRQGQHRLGIEPIPTEAWKNA